MYMFTGGVDFSDITVMRVTFPAGATAVNFSIGVTIDGVYEGNETLGLSVDPTPAPAALRVGIGDQGTAIGEIIDDRKLIIWHCMNKVCV